MPARRRNNLLANCDSAAGLLIAASGALAQTRPSSSSFRIGCRPPIRCRRRWSNGAPRREASNGTINRRCSRPAVGQGSIITTWRGTASPTSTMSIRATARPLSHHLRRRVAVPRRRRQGASAGRHLVSQIRAERDEGREILLLLHPRSLTWHSSKKKIVVPGDIKGMKVRPRSNGSRLGDAVGAPRAASATRCAM